MITALCNHPQACLVFDGTGRYTSHHCSWCADIARAEAAEQAYAESEAKHRALVAYTEQLRGAVARWLSVSIDHGCGKTIKYHIRDCVEPAVKALEGALAASGDSNVTPRE